MASSCEKTLFIRHGLRSCVLAAALTTNAAYAAGLNFLPEDAFRDWYVVDDTHKVCANVNSKAVRDWNQSPHDKMFDSMVKTEPSTPDMQIGAWHAQGKQVHTIVVVDPAGRDSTTLGQGAVLFEIVYYKESEDKVVRRVFFAEKATCSYVAAHNALPTDITTVVMTIDGDNANAMRMARDDFDHQVMDKAH
jgi:hypothetical protein